jgi:hypothetical protein
MSVVPLEGYDVEFIPLERRLMDRRMTSGLSPLPSGLQKDRRQSAGRRAQDLRHAAQGKSVQ